MVLLAWLALVLSALALAMACFALYTVLRGPPRKRRR
jgi:hypothetical protein